MLRIWRHGKLTGIVSCTKLLSISIRWDLKHWMKTFQKSKSSWPTRECPISAAAFSADCWCTFISSVLIVWCLCIFVCSRQRIQFRPPIEEIKSKYYREMKKFISIPNIFRGVSSDATATDLIFRAMIDRNASGFHTCYYKASELFKRLDSVQNVFKVRIFSPCHNHCRV